MFVAISPNARLLPQTPQNLLLGTWSGEVHYGEESKLMALRFDLDKEKNAMVAFFDVPEMKFHNLGPIPVTRQGDEYKAVVFSFRLATDKRSLTGKWSFDGHDLAFELKPSPPLAESAPSPSASNIARPLWTFKTGGAVWSSPVVVEDIVYFGSSDGIIYAVNARSGKPHWQYKTAGPVMGRPASDGPYLYAPSDDGYLYKLERKSGRLVWRFDTHGGAVPRELPNPKSPTYDYLASAATVFNGTVYIGSADKKLYAVDAKTGRERWHFDTQNIVRSTPAVADGMVVIGSYDHNVYAVDAKSGALRWKFDTLRPVVSSPLFSDGTIFIGSRSSDFFALGAATGRVKWKYFYWSSWVESSARLHNGILYVGSSDYQQLFAIDAVSGRRIWNVNVDGSAWSTPAVTDEAVYIGVVGVDGYMINHHGSFYAVDRATGAVAWRFPMNVIPGAFCYGVASSPAVHKDLVFFGGLDGTFYAFRTSPIPKH
jgi:outer membrane protein assembly factor BamB